MGKIREHGLDRALQVFECLHKAQIPLSVGEIARRLEAPRSTIYNIVNRFLEADILEMRASDGAVFFGRTLYFYAADYFKGNGSLQRVRAEVDRLSEAIQETVEYCTLQGDKYVTVYMQTGSRRSMKISSVIGARLPIPWTASGRLLLGGMSREETRALIPPEDFTLPNGQAIDFDAFYQEVQRAKQEGFFVASGLVNDYATCIAVPVYGGSQTVVAALSVIVAIGTLPQRIDALVSTLKQSVVSLSADVFI